MVAGIKTNFEKWLIANLLTQEGTKFYFMVGAIKVYVYFEGQSSNNDDNFLNLKIVPEDRQTVATNTIFSTGSYVFYIYSKNVLNPDKITDALAGILDEKTIEQTQGFRIETGIMRTRYRAQKFAESDHYENIAEIGFRYWA